jgi:hypothetical protein
LTGLPHDTPTAIGQTPIKLGPELAVAILLTMRAGWARALSSPDVRADAEEIPMTERLRDGMREAHRDDPKLRRLSMIIAPGTESRSRPELPRPDGRTDIPIFVIKLSVRRGDHDPHAIIECKRIAGDNTRLCREYVIEGIDRFRTGKYGLNHALGFMAGYVLSGNAAAVVARINTYLAETEQLATSDLISDCPEIWRSRHPRAEPNPSINLHHVFLPIASMA